MYRLMFPCGSLAIKAIFGSLPPTTVGVTVGVNVGEGVDVEVGEGVSVDVAGITAAVGVDSTGAAHEASRYITRRKTYFFILFSFQW
jgi:hypothetical protein